MISRFRHEDMLTFFLSASALFLPYVSFEPAPVDFFLLAAAVVYLRDGGYLPKSALYIFFAYLLFYFSSGLFSAVGNRINEDKFARYYIVEIFLAALTLATYAIFSTSTRRIELFLKYYCIGAVISCILILSIYVLFPSLDLIYRDAFRVRVKGFFKDPNVLGPYLIFPLLMLSFAPRRIGLSKLWSLGVIPMLPVLFLSYSRASLGAFFASAAMLVLMRIFTGFSKRAMVLTIFVVSLFLVGITSELERIHGFLSNLQNFQDRMSMQSYDSDRFSDIIHGFSVGAIRVFGLGPASYESIYNSLSPHNLFVAKLVDGGWIPALIISWFMLFPMWACFGEFLRTRDSFFLILFCVFFAHGMMSMIINPHHWRHLLLLCGIAFAVRRSSRGCEREKQSVRLNIKPDVSGRAQTRGELSG